MSALLALALIGCNGPADGTRRVIRVDDDPPRDTAAARRENAAAADLLEAGKAAEAEPHLRRAVAADPKFGPAWNNLGAALFHLDRPAAAADAFETAAGLMPASPDPRNGLGLVLEASGRVDQAIVYFDRAVALDPGNVEYLGNAARARVRRGDRTDEVRGMLARLAVDDPRPDWNAWERETLGRLRPTTRE